MRNRAEFQRTGACLFEGAALGALDQFEAIFENLPQDQAGIRLHGLEQLRPILSSNGVVGLVAGKLFNKRPKPIRAILFDKSAETNWALGWHQDRTICVEERREVAGFGPWTIKHGYHHVAPPFELLERMVTLRIHLDDVPANNAPLMIALGSHRFGLIPEREIENTVQRCDILTCLADAGDVWAYATPILHASDSAEQPAHRRVLQVDYSIDDLPNGLQWLGI